METDKKIEEYLERAEKIVRDWEFETNVQNEVLEIAKMIQLEEHRANRLMTTTNDGIREIPMFKGTRGQLEDLYKGEDPFIN